MVEFVLVLLPLLVFVGGVIQLGIGIADWHDGNRIANEGARFAAVNHWPDCPSGLQPCTGFPTKPGGEPDCHPTNPSALNGRSLLHYLRCEAIDAGLPGNMTVVVCRPGASATIGDPVTVRLTSRRHFLSLDNSSRASWAGITLRAEATMRIETTPSYPTVAC